MADLYDFPDIYDERFTECMWRLETNFIPHILPTIHSFLFEMGSLTESEDP